MPAKLFHSGGPSKCILKTTIFKPQIKMFHFRSKPPSSASEIFPNLPNSWLCDAGRIFLSAQVETASWTACECWRPLLKQGNQECLPSCCPFLRKSFSASPHMHQISGYQDGHPDPQRKFPCPARVFLPLVNGLKVCFNVWEVLCPQNRFLKIIISAQAII